MGARTRKLPTIFVQGLHLLLKCGHHVGFQNCKIPQHKQNSSGEFQVMALKPLELSIRLRGMIFGGSKAMDGWRYVPESASSLRSCGETRSIGKWKEALSSPKPPLLLLLLPLWPVARELIFSSLQINSTMALA